MDNLSYIIGLNNGEGGGGASSWSDIDGKPFNTVGTGLTTTGKVLAIDSTVVTDSDLATVATTGDYDDLLNKPTIPSATSVTVTQTLQSGTAIADIDVDGVTTTLYAPSGGSLPFSSIGNGLTITAGGALQEAVPIYSESTVVPGVTYGPGLIVETTISSGNSDFDYTQEMPSNSYLSLTYETNYYVTANIDDNIYTGLWNTGLQGDEHSYGGFSWEVYNEDGEYVDTWEFYIENEEDEGYYGQRFHIYPNGMECDHLYWFIIEPVDPLTEQNLTEANVESYDYTWGSITGEPTTVTTYHKLPLAYMPDEYASFNPLQPISTDNFLGIGCNIFDAMGRIGIEVPISDDVVGGQLDSVLDGTKGSWTSVDGWVEDNKWYINNFKEDATLPEYVWLRMPYFMSNPDPDRKTLYVIYGKITITAGTGAVPVMTIEGLEPILSSVSFNYYEQAYELQFKSGIYVSGDYEAKIFTGYDITTALSKQNINAYFLPLNNDTLEVDSNGNIRTIAPIKAGTGIRSVAEGNVYFTGDHGGAYTTASGDYSHAEGYYTTASGDKSHAEGSVNTAAGEAAHAEGAWNHADGQCSHAEGYVTRANGGCSHVEGNGTTASSMLQHVQGKFNIADPQGATMTLGLYADIIGNGTENTHSNAEATDWNGNKYLAGDVYVGVTNWGTTPTVGATKLARVPAVTTVPGTYTLQVVVDSNGDPTYSWIAQV